MYINIYTKMSFTVILKGKKKKKGKVEERRDEQPKVTGTVAVPTSIPQTGTGGQHFM
jgi:hypothetical protein